MDDDRPRCTSEFPFPPSHLSGVALRDLPEDDRPRERLLRLGAEALADAELVAILLRTGVRGCSALELGVRHLASEGGLAGLARRDPSYLARLAGVGDAKAAILSAALELGRRLARPRASTRPFLGSPDRLEAWLHPRASEWPEERVGALMLDSRHRLVHDREIVRGSLDAAAVTPRDILRRCLLDEAASFVLYHNHPSGDPTPSRDDLELTRALALAARQVGVRLADHVVVGREGCVSLARRGLLQP